MLFRDAGRGEARCPLSPLVLLASLAIGALAPADASAAAGAKPWSCRAPFRLRDALRLAEGPEHHQAERIEELTRLHAEGRADKTLRKADRVSLEGVARAPRREIQVRGLFGLGGETSITVFGAPYRPKGSSRLWIDFERGEQAGSASTGAGTSAGNSPILQRIPVDRLSRAIGREWVERALRPGSSLVAPADPALREDPSRLEEPLEILTVASVAPSGSLRVLNPQGELRLIRWQDAFYWNFWVSIEERKLLRRLRAEGGAGIALYEGEGSAQDTAQTGIYVALDRLPRMEDQAVARFLQALKDEEGAEIGLTTDSRGFLGAAVPPVNALARRLIRIRGDGAASRPMLVLTSDRSRRTLVHEAKHVSDYAEGGFLDTFIETELQGLQAAGLDDDAAMTLLGFVMEQRAYSEHYFFALEHEYRLSRDRARELWMQRPAIAKEIGADRDSFLRNYGEPLFQLLDSLERDEAGSERLETSLAFIRRWEEKLPLFEWDDFAADYRRWQARERARLRRGLPSPGASGPSTP